MRVIVILAICLGAVSAAPSNPQRIVGGSEANILHWPQMGALLYSSNLNTYLQICGGTILTTRSILTAAHCVIDSGAVNWRVRLGSSFANSGGIIHTVLTIINHVSFNRVTYDNDIAILRLTTNIVYAANMNAASFPGSNYNLADNTVVWAIGWGSTVSGGAFSEQLRQVQIWTVNQSVCRERYADIGFTVTDNMICSGYLDVGGRDQCLGDDGGPLFHNHVAVGIRSWGVGCGLALFPGVNTRISNYSTWLQNNA